MSPRSQEQIEKIRSQSTGKILEAAFELMAQNGYEATSISQIAKHAGISKGLIYNYFDSKEDMLKALVNHALDEADHLMEDIVDDDPRQTIENMLRWFFDELRERPEHWRLITELTMKLDKLDFVKEMATNKLQEMAVFFGEMLRKTGVEHPEEEALVIVGLFDGIGLQYLVIGKDYPLDRMEHFLIEKYCR
jgi:AcrR family transcriptional regulator